MVRYILLLLLAYAFVPRSVRPSTPVVDVPKTRETKAFICNSCCKRRPSFWSCVFWTFAITIFVALELLGAVLKQSVKNCLAVLTLGQGGISFGGYMMHQGCKHRLLGVSRLVASLWCSVNAVLQDLTPTECICAEWLGVHRFGCSTSSFLCCAVLWAACNRLHMPTLLNCRCLSALVAIALQSSWVDVVAAFLLPTFPLEDTISQDGDVTEIDAVVGDLESVRPSKNPKTTAGPSATGTETQPKSGENADAAGNTARSLLHLDRSTLNVHEYWNAHAGLTLRALRTMDDGACSVHAVVGTVRSGIIQHSNPRDWIGNVLTTAGALATCRQSVRRLNIAIYGQPLPVLWKTNFFSPSFVV